jgi:protein CpxP
MTMKFNRAGAFASAVLLATIATAPVALSQSTDNPGEGRKGSHERRFRGGRGMRGGFEFRQLNLTDDQKAQMRQIRKAHFESTAALRQQLRAAMKQIHGSTNGNFDEALVSQRLAETAPLRAKLMADSFRMRQEIAGVLTTEQKAKLEQLREQSKARRAEHRTRKTQKSSQN